MTSIVENAEEESEDTLQPPLAVRVFLVSGGLHERRHPPIGLKAMTTRTSVHVGSRERSNALQCPPFSARGTASLGRRRRRLRGRVQLLQRERVDAPLQLLLERAHHHPMPL